ncbi:MAG: hypothetical protein JW974_00950 [Alphaproteobacteria bacterium]|nr:hypothetical protein [Alphaproteobacteria bacterium]MBN2674864.1 hypothetical protein [Alphaproteobacteria bacterium]
MAKKQVKKAAVTKKVVAKKAPAKKPVAAKPVAKKAPAKKPVAAKPVVKAAAPAPETKFVMEAPIASVPSCGCCCRNFGFCRFVRKLIVFFVIFALGYAAAIYCPHSKRFFNNGPRMQEVFVNGCLDVAKLPNPDMVEKIKTADTNADNCISKDEFDAVRAEFRKENRADRPAGPMRR